MEKKCSRCGAHKMRSEFTTDRRRPDGLNPRCRVCTRAANAAYQAKNPEKVNERSRAWYAANKDRKREVGYEWLRAHPGKAAAYCAAWRIRNPGAQSAADASWYRRNRAKKLAQDRARRNANLKAFLERERASYAKFRENRAARGAEWRRKNKFRTAYHAAQRRSAIRDRTPAWLTRREMDRMLGFFREAARKREKTGLQHHVDHVVPLRGKTVSGLNVPWNLQVIPATDNLKKSNKHGT